MIDSKDIGISLIVAMHTALGAIAAGKIQDALLYAAGGGGCYLIIRGTLWLGQRLFGSKADADNGRTVDNG